VIRGPWGALAWHDGEATGDPGRPRSHDHRGGTVVWHPPGPGTAAVDAESLRRPLDPALRRRWGAADDAGFLARWTVGEVLAKLSGTPIAVWLSEHGLPAAVPGHSQVPLGEGVADLWHLEVPGREAVVTCGLLVPGPDPAGMT